MKKLSSILLCMILLAVFATLAHAGLDDFIRKVNAEAKEDISRFNAKLSLQFGIPLPKVEDLLRKVPSPGDAFMILQIGEMSRKQPEMVLQTYQASRDKGWGAIAKEMGIKPGSRDFHALKRGDLSFTGKPAGGSQQSGKSKKGKGHNKN